MKFAWVLLCSLVFQLVSFGQVNHWETIIMDSSDWRYIIPTASTPSDWISPAFNDASWTSAPGGFGFGDNDDGTSVPNGTISVYHRIVFNVNDWSAISRLVFNMDFDDGYVAYLNGSEIARSNLTSVGQPSWDALADGQHEAVLYQGGYPEQTILEIAPLAGILLSGQNVLCIETHNVTNASADLTSRAFLHAGINIPDSLYSPTPSWFVPPFEFSQSNLPIVVINTYGVDIPDEPKIDAEMGIINNGPGNVNHLQDPFNEFSGWIAIERRGSSSNMFPAKSYGIETRGPDSVNYNASIFNWPIDNDWILYAPYTDKSLIRNVLTYRLGNEMGRWAPRTQLCEVLLNGEYMGIYVFMERIKQNPGRVSIDPLQYNDTLDNELTGGYIVKIDKTTGGGIIAWTSPYLAQAPSTVGISYQMHDPDLTELHPTQLSYIQDYITQWEDALADSNFAHPTLGYRPFIDVQSFIDFFMMNEVAKNVDGYRISTFLYKQRFSEGGKLVAGPLWDFNLAWGNADYCLGGETYGWEIDFNQYCGGGLDNPFWWKRMLEDSTYANEVKCRWLDLRNSILDTTYLFHYIDSLQQLLEVPASRHYQRWPILGSYVWPNNFIGNSFQDEINYLKSWTSARLTWLDENMFGLCDTTDTFIENESISSFSLFPNPNHGKCVIETKVFQTAHIELRSVSGQLIDVKNLSWEGNQVLNYSNLPMGFYFLTIHTADNSVQTFKMIIE